MLIRKLRLYASSLLLLLALAVPVTAGASPLTLLAADAKSEICKGIGAVQGGGNCQTSGPSIEKIVRTVVNILSLIGGIVAVIMIIISGLKYVTSSGDASNVSSAKNTLIYAIIGLVIIALAQVIVRFVFTSVQ